MNKCTSILLVGVGGQGTILAAKVLSQVALEQGLEVKMSEVHGMSQRGGSVVTFVKFGEQVFSPIVEPGEADFIVAFEKLEALRWAHYLKPTGVLITNDQEISPMPVITGAVSYPEGIIEQLQARGQHVIGIKALELAKNCGNSKATNLVLMGVLAKQTEIDQEIWLKAVDRKVPAKFLDLNRKAFLAGYQIT
jgi:indolepyruvate ferredoxin oxidoreductase, beta subunit